MRCSVPVGSGVEMGPEMLVLCTRVWHRSLSDIFYRTIMFLGTLTRNRKVSDKSEAYLAANKSATTHKKYISLPARTTC